MPDHRLTGAPAASLAAVAAVVATAVASAAVASSAVAVAAAVTVVVATAAVASTAVASAVEVAAVEVAAVAMGHRSREQPPNSLNRLLAQNMLIIFMTKLAVLQCTTKIPLMRYLKQRKYQ